MNFRIALTRGLIIVHGMQGLSQVTLSHNSDEIVRNSEIHESFGYQYFGLSGL